MCVSCSVMSDSVTPWTVARQAPLSMGFSRQEYWSELPLPSPEESSQPRDCTGSPALQADSLVSEPLGKPHLPIVNPRWVIEPGFEKRQPDPSASVLKCGGSFCLHFGRPDTHLCTATLNETTTEKFDEEGKHIKYNFSKKLVQWLRICLVMQGMWIWSQGRELGSHVLQSNWVHMLQLESRCAETKDPMCHN